MKRMKNMVSKQREKERILLDLQKARRNIITAALRLPPNQHDQVFLGTWTIKDVLAHLIGWDYTNMESAEAVQNGKLPAFYESYDKDWKSYNAHLVRLYKLEDWEQLITSVEASHSQLVNYFENIAAEDFFKDWGVRFKGYKVIISRLLEAETKDEITHHEQIQSLLKKTTAQEQRS